MEVYTEIEKRVWVIMEYEHLRYKSFLKKRGCNTVRTRCLQFIEVLKQSGYANEIPLENAKELFMKTMGIMDRTSIKSYFGSQAHRTIRKIQKIARYGTGTTSYKMIELAQEVPQKRGYFELLGLAKFELRGSVWFMILTNETLVPELFPQHYESSECSIENLSLSPISHSPIEKPKAEALEEEVSVGETEVSPRTERPQRNDKGGENREGGTEKKEEEVIDSTHTNQSRVKVNTDFPSIHRKVELKCSLTEEEMAILTAKPTPKKCVDCGRIDATNPYRVLCPKGMGMRSRSDVCVYEGGP